MRPKALRRLTDVAVSAAAVSGLSASFPSVFSELIATLPSEPSNVISDALAHDIRSIRRIASIFRRYNSAFCHFYRGVLGAC